MNKFLQGEKGSINDLVNRCIHDDMDIIAMELYGKYDICLNVIYTLEKEYGSEFAVRFACKVIKLLS